MVETENGVTHYVRVAHLLDETRTCLPGSPIATCSVTSSYRVIGTRNHFGEMDWRAEYMDDLDVACADGQSTSAAKWATIDAAAVYKTNCATCHGDAGRGDGPAGAALDPKPTGFADPAFWESRSPQRVKTAFTQGGPAIGASPLMVPFGHLFPTEADKDAMVSHLMSFANK